MDDDSNPSEVFTPKKSALSRQAAERNALRKTASHASLKHSDLPTSIQPQSDSARPSYSKEYLEELKSSTPSTPRSQRSESVAVPSTTSTSLDIAAKFGTDLAKYGRGSGTAIPTETEIQEKKARRARLAKEQKYKPDADSDASDNGDDIPDDLRDRDSDEDEFRSHRDEISLSADTKSSKHPDATARLVADDDEDLLDDSILTGTPNRMHVGKAAERERRAVERAQRAEQIDDAQVSSSESSSGDELEGGEADRRAAYDAAQTRAGMAGLYIDSSECERQERKDGAMTPLKMTPLPALAKCAEKIARRIQELEESVQGKVRGLEEVEREREEIKGQEEGVQKLLDEVGERWRRLNGVDDEDVDMGEVMDRPGLGAGLGVGIGMGIGMGLGSGAGLGFGGGERGLESLGGTPIGTPVRNGTAPGGMNRAASAG